MHSISSPRSITSIVQALLDALDAGTTVVTANNRTAAWLREQFNLAQQEHGKSAWSTPQILPWQAWVRTLWQRLRAGHRPPRERLLTPWQARRIWTGVIASHASDTLLHSANAVDHALRAWETTQGWNGQWAQWGGDDARDEQRMFVTWAAAFTRRCADNNWIDAARLPPLIIDAVRERALVIDEPLAFYGFAEFSPRQQHLLDALAKSGTRVAIHDGRDRHDQDTRSATRIECADPSDEYLRCAQWCRELLARNPTEKIGVVIPDLAQRKRQVERVFTEMLGPRSLLDGTNTAPPFDISHGEPLSSQPLVDVALTLLTWARAPIGFAELSALARSRYLGGFADEQPMRAHAIRKAIEQPFERWPLAEFARFAARHAPAWSEQLRALASTGGTWNKHRNAKEWRGTWEEALKAAGWLAGYKLDSVEFQVHRAWSEMLDGWMRAENISGTTANGEALSSLEQLAEATIFQPESPPVPVQILGALEAAGLRFDSLWVCGLTAERWPPAPAPSALLPLGWQRSVAAPHATAERELRYYRELTAQLAGAAETVIFSWPSTIDDVPQTPSALLNEFSSAAVQPLLADPQPGLGALIRQAGRLQPIDDRQGLPIAPPEPASGPGTVIEAEAHCPFHAYARFRLGTEPWPTPSLGLNPLERGKLVHCMLDAFWKALKQGSAALLALSVDQRRSRIAQAVEVALESLGDRRWAQLGASMRDLERARLSDLLDEWLTYEAARAPFTVVDTESKQQLVVNGLNLGLRVDRIDAAGDDRWIVTDYKTGKSSINGLLDDDRLIAPQLALYADAVAPANVVGVAYATVLRGKCGANGIGVSPDDWDALEPAVPDWPTRRAQWRRDLDALAADYLSGKASVDPWRYPLSCNRCNRHALCRINERLAFVPTADDASGDAAIAIAGDAS